LGLGVGVFTFSTGIYDGVGVGGATHV
jgi:hypothetical protein